MDTSVRKKLMSARDAADCLKVSLSAVYKWVAAGRIPYVDFGREGANRCIRFDPVALDKFIAGKSHE